ncbi:MAG: DNA alkylation repair protein [Clostridia bacterium]|nr:DNA alkylation repair protein [Clostridia bacterium]
MNEQILSEFLNSNKNEEQAKFIKRLSPTVKDTYGIKIPILRDFAKTLAKEQGLSVLDGFCPKSREEILIFGYVISYAKGDFEQKLSYVKYFVSLIYSWDTCDCVITFNKKDYLKVFALCKEYLKSDKEFDLRFAIVNLKIYCLTPAILPEVLSLLDDVKSKDYYVLMAIAWLLADVITFYPEIALKFLQETKLDKFTVNKAIQKARESYRVPSDLKELLLTYKR